jgi:hypothetical protein
MTVEGHIALSPMDAELVQFTEPMALGSPYGVTPIFVKCTSCGAMIEPEDTELHRGGVLHTRPVLDRLIEWRTPE